jgi:hypothetical protein
VLRWKKIDDDEKVFVEKQPEVCSGYNFDVCAVHYNLYYTL